MTKEELIRVLVLLSQIEGFVIGKVGGMCLPDYIDEELHEVVNILADEIKKK